MIKEMHAHQFNDMLNRDIIESLLLNMMHVNKCMTDQSWNFCQFQPGNKILLNQLLPR